MLTHCLKVLEMMLGSLKKVNRRKTEYMGPFCLLHLGLLCFTFCLIVIPCAEGKS